MRPAMAPNRKLTPAVTITKLQKRIERMVIINWREAPNVAPTAAEERKEVTVDTFAGCWIHPRLIRKASSPEAAPPLRNRAR